MAATRAIPGILDDVAGAAETLVEAISCSFMEGRHVVLFLVGRKWRLAQAVGQNATNTGTTDLIGTAIPVLRLRNRTRVRMTGSTGNLNRGGRNADH